MTTRYEVWLPNDSWGDGFKPFVISERAAAVKAKRLCDEWGSGEPCERPTEELEKYLRNASEEDIDELDFASDRAFEAFLSLRKTM